MASKKVQNIAEGYAYGVQIGDWYYVASRNSRRLLIEKTPIDRWQLKVVSRHRTIDDLEVAMRDIQSDLRRWGQLHYYFVE